MTEARPPAGHGEAPLAGQVALVTGAGRGIGHALALALSGAGAKVGLLGRTRGPLEQTMRACVAADPDAKVVVAPADVRSPDAVRGAVQAVRHAVGPIDLVVNNAGRIDRAETPPWQADPHDWWQVVETNLRGVFNVCRAVLPAMVERGAGRIVNLNSGFAFRPESGYSAYAVSKGALSRLTDSLASATAGRGVVVLDVSPGTVSTEMTRGMARFATRGAKDWTPVQRVVDLVLAVAVGQLDELSGRFAHAAKDDVAELIRQAERIRTADARGLRLRPYGPDDPLG